MTRRVGGDGAGGVKKLVGFVFGLCLCVVVAAAAVFFSARDLTSWWADDDGIRCCYYCYSCHPTTTCSVYILVYVYKYVHRKKWRRNRTWKSAWKNGIMPKSICRTKGLLNRTHKNLLSASHPSYSDWDPLEAQYFQRSLDHKPAVSCWVHKKTDWFVPGIT